MSELQVALAGQRHFEDIREIIIDSFQGPQSQYSAIGQPGYLTYLDDFLNKKARGPKYLIVGMVQGQAAAFADITVRENAPNFLTRIAVKPEFRGQGIAGRLMSQIQRTYGSRNDWELDVFHSNSGAKRLYESLGFEVTATRKWVGRYLTETLVRVDDKIVKPLLSDPNYLRYGFTNVEHYGRSVSIAGTAVRCHDLDLFLDDVLLTKVQEIYRKVDRAFIVLDDSAAHVSDTAKVFEIDRSYRMLGTF